MLSGTLGKQQYLFPYVDDMLFHALNRKTKETTYWYAIGLADNPPRRTEEPPPPRHRRRIIERLLYLGCGIYMVVAIRIGDFSRKN